MQTKQYIGSVVAVGILTTGLLLGGPVQAQSTTSPTQTNPFQKLVEKIAATFNLDKSKVQTVVEEFHKERQVERQTEMKARQEERLSKLVSEGKITEAQKQAIIKKHEELKAQFNPDGFKNMTAEERKTAMDKKKAELDAWAQSQGIDPSYLMMGKGMRGGMHRGTFDTPPAQ